MNNIQAVVDILEEDFGIQVEGCDEQQLASMISRLQQLRDLMVQHSVEEAPAYSGA